MTGDEIPIVYLDPLEYATHPSWFPVPEMPIVDGVAWAHSIEHIPGVGNFCLPDCDAPSGHIWPNRTQS